MRFSLLLLAGIALALMATGDADAKEPEWNYTTEPIGPCCGLTRSISVDISADGEYTAVGGYGKVYLFDKYSNIALWSYDVGSDAYSIAISADGEYIVAGSEEIGRAHV